MESELIKIKEKLRKYYTELDEIENLITKIQDKEEVIKLTKLWKSRENKYYKVKLWHTNECEYVFVSKVSKSKMNILTGFSEDKWKYYKEYDFFIEDFGSGWEEISKEEFELITKDYKLEV